MCSLYKAERHIAFNISQQPEICKVFTRIHTVWQYYIRYQNCPKSDIPRQRRITLKKPRSEERGFSVSRVQKRTGRKPKNLIISLQNEPFILKSLKR